MTISVVIPAYNGLTHLQKNLPAVNDLSVMEIIVIDDCSTDDTASYVHKKFPQIKYIRESRNVRFPKNANAGVLAAKGDIVILLNQDVKPEKNLIKNLLPHFLDPNIFAVTFNEGERSWATGTFHHGFLQYSQGTRDTAPHESLWASGGSAAFSRSKWLELGGFDSVFTPGYYEDFDLGWRARLHHWKIIWDPECKVNHDHPESTFSTTFSPKSLTQLKERNYLLAHWKNLTTRELMSHVVYLCIRILRSPGFIVPTLHAFIKLPHIITYRLHA